VSQDQLETLIDLEFDTGATGRAPLGDIASSLVSIDELLRDLAALAAYPATVEFRQIQVAEMTTRNPLKVKLSLLAIPNEAVKAFEDICREVIVFRERSSQQAIDAILKRCGPHGASAGITDQEAQRIYHHVATLQNAKTPLKRIVVRET
jgi:hypothetical protein